MAISKDKKEIMAFLIENGADVNLADGQGWHPPISKTIDEGNIGIIKILFQNGAKRSQSVSSMPYITYKTSCQEILPFGVFGEKFCMYSHQRHSSSVTSTQNLTPQD